MNSTRFDRVEAFPKEFQRDNGERVTRQMRFARVGMINMGLMLGLKRSGGSFGLNDQTSPISNIGARARAITDQAPEELREKVLKEFIKIQRPLLAKMGNIPWFIPEWLGGLGLPRIGAFQPSEKDLKIASAIYRTYSENPPMKPRVITHWKARTIAEKRIGVPTVIIKHGGPEITDKGTEQAIGLETINLLFDSNIALNDLFDPEEEGKGQKEFIKHNKKLWNGHLIADKPLKLDELKYSPPVTYLATKRLPWRGRVTVGPDGLVIWPNATEEPDWTD